jgi:hypothetical protein
LQHGFILGNIAAPLHKHLELVVGEQIVNGIQSLLHRDVRKLFLQLGVRDCLRANSQGTIGIAAI